MMPRLERSAWWGLSILTTVVVATFLLPLILPFGPTDVDFDSILVGPYGRHLLGTDVRGMDILARTLAAPKVDLVVALVSTTLAVVVGVPLGTIAGMFENRGRLGSAVAQVIMRTMDVLQAIPVFVFALAVVAALGGGLTNVILAMGFVNAPVFVRLIRAEMLQWRDASFVEAARLAGWSPMQIAFRHLLPNALSASVAQASVILGFSILLTAGLSFVGAGVRPPTAEWGVMISEGAKYLATGEWWLAVFPGIAMGLTVLGFSLVGEGLRNLVHEGRLRLRLRGSGVAEKILAAELA
jgi:peptide/nickel transport system permease protein